MRLLTPLIAAALLGCCSLAHPGHDVKHEVASRAAFMQNSKRDLSHCTERLKARQVEQRAITRRRALAAKARKARDITEEAPFLNVRDGTDRLNISHHSAHNYSAATPGDVVFSSNNSCVLAAEVTQGPYYVSGEYVRDDLREDQEGVELILDTQVIDMARCEPVTNAVVEIWQCNSTGVYSGIVNAGNGAGLDDPANLNTTFLRGLVATDSDGVAQFRTNFPGHYNPRANHIHAIVHMGGKILPNGTYAQGHLSHVGQIFFDQDLITAVEETYPYNINKQNLVTNAEDYILSKEPSSSDPLAEYSYLGKKVEDGIFAWTTFAIDLTQDFYIHAAASYQEDGGVINAADCVDPVGCAEFPVEK